MIPRRSKQAARRGVTLTEVVMSAAVLGLLVVGALDAVGASVTTRERIVERSRGQALADELMAHIVTRPYVDWDLARTQGDHIDVSASETAAGRWGVFNDVDDFHGWSAAPPELADGSAVPGFDATWRRSAVVEWVSLANPGTRVGASQGVKRITVRVEHHGRLVGEAVAFRTAAQDLSDDPGLLEALGGVVGGVLGGLLGGLGL